jgi:hypothetical protein
MLKTWYVVHFLVPTRHTCAPQVSWFFRLSGIRYLESQVCSQLPAACSAHSFLVPGGRDASRMVWVGLWSLHGCLSGHFYAPPATGSLNWYPPGCSGRCHGHRMQRAWEGCLSWEAFPLGLPFPHSLFTPPWPLFMHTGMLRMIIVMPKLLRT